MPANINVSGYFGSWQSLAINTQKPLIAYGVTGHGKGLVDAMSGFGVKGPLSRAVILEDFTYNSAEDIHTYMKKKFENDNLKHHFLLDKESIDDERKKKSALKIKNCIEKHMIAFFPDGSIQTKINLCSCDKCMLGLFTECPYEQGSEIQVAVEDGRVHDE